MNKITKIVLVEDNPADAQLAHLAFKSISPEANVINFSNGKDFLDHLDQSNIEPISLVLLDLNMPQMNGTEVLKTLQKNKSWAKIPVVVFSSSKQEDDIQSCYDLGANAYVTKPFDYSEFEQTIEAIARFWGNLNQSPSQKNRMLNQF